MTIYIKKDGIIYKRTYNQDVANLESFERELDEEFEEWSFDKLDIEPDIPMQRCRIYECGSFGCTKDEHLEEI